MELCLWNMCINYTCVCLCDHVCIYTTCVHTYAHMCVWMCVCAWKKIPEWEKVFSLRVITVDALADCTDILSGWRCSFSQPSEILTSSLTKTALYLQDSYPILGALLEDSMHSKRREFRGLKTLPPWLRTIAFRTILRGHY